MDECHSQKKGPISKQKCRLGPPKLAKTQILKRLKWMSNKGLKASKSAGLATLVYKQTDIKFEIIIVKTYIVKGVQAFSSAVW